jgi:hypothetical protein
MLPLMSCKIEKLSQKETKNGGMGTRRVRASTSIGSLFSEKILTTSQKTSNASSGAVRDNGHNIRATLALQPQQQRGRQQQEAVRENKVCRNVLFSTVQ